MELVVCIWAVNKKTGTIFNRIDDDLVQGLRNGRATPASSQKSQCMNRRLINIRSPMHDNGACPGVIVNIFFKPIEPERVAVFSRISFTGDVKSGATF